MRKQILISLTVLAVLSTALATKAQDIVTREIGRGDLAPIEGVPAAGKVTWFLDSVGTRKSNVSCTIETEFTNSTGELLFRLTDKGGLSGDPACKLRLLTPPLRNNYVFEGVDISTFFCGNDACSTSKSSVAPGSNLFEVNVKGGMKGVLIGFPARKSIFRVRVRLRGPANSSPF